LELFRSLQTCGLQHTVKSALWYFLSLVSADWNEVRVVRMHVFVVPFASLDCPAMLFNQSVKL